MAQCSKKHDYVNKTKLGTELQAIPISTVLIAQMMVAHGLIWKK
jgi:hypothetical protein